MVEAPAEAVKFELLLSDYHAMMRHVCAPGSSRFSAALLVWIATVFFASAGMSLFGRDGRAFPAGMVAGFLLMLANGMRTQRRLRPRPQGAVLCHYELQLTQDGMHVQTPVWRSDLLWRGILAVEETPAHCFLRIDSASVYTIPKRAFADGEASRQFIDFARSCVSRARAG